MNAVTRALGARAINLPVLNILPLSQQTVVTLIIALGFLISALGIVYVKDLNRRLFIQVDRLKQQEIIADQQWSKLLLEKSTLTAQTRIQTLATTQLNMAMPLGNGIHLLDNNQAVNQ